MRALDYHMQHRRPQIIHPHDRLIRLAAAVAFCLVIWRPALAWAWAPQASHPERIIVTGACEGVGLALLTQLLEAGAEVTAGLLPADDTRQVMPLLRRYAHNLRLGHVNLADQASVSAFAARFGAQGVDTFIHVAAVHNAAHRAFGVLPAAAVAETYAAHATGPYRLAQALFSALKQRPRPIVACIAAAPLRAAVAYGDDRAPERARADQANKAALHLLTTTLAATGGPIIGLALHPGEVGSAPDDAAHLAHPSSGAALALDPQTSAAKLLEVIAQATPQHANRYFCYTGAPIAW